MVSKDVTDKAPVVHAQAHRNTLSRPAELAAEMDIVKPLEVRVSPQLNAWPVRKRTVIRPTGLRQARYCSRPGEDISDSGSPT